ncbi:DNA damage-regulated autophagy modulator protein 2-like [Cimex lectularius]|uniref:CWH43-like N-terminal domain-containing protein n=1 Tax=Cimex lectularius TaxID=79782 RepID=A0A8I6S4K5_CIMLE|nr:DNA damage-regulated autophagy modulator protein 2-like [Cimex lectularius]
MSTFVEWIPIVIFIGLPATFIATYIWSVCLDHVYPVLPNISDTGTIPPESCLFSMMLNMTAAALLFAIYVRHKQVVEIFRSKTPAKCAKLVNRVSSISGLVACVGLDLVANFQETNVLIVHDLGAMICFWSSAVYIVLQVILSYWIVPEMHGMVMVIIRGIQGMSAVTFLILGLITQNIALSQFGPKQANNTEILQWKPSEPGWEWHVASSVCEWSVVLTFGSFILTFYWDFKKITLYAPELELVEGETDEQDGVQVKTFRSLGS